MPFTQSKLKIARARTHISDLNNEISAFIDRKPYVIVPDRKTEPFSFLLRVSIREEIPDNFSLIIGDAIHNIRTSLDLLACDLVRLNGECASDVYFPFAKDANSLENSIKSRKVDLAGINVVKVIHALKPYRGGDTNLYGIHALDIIDKHQRLITAAHTAGATVFEVSRGDSYSQIARIETGLLEDGMIIGTDTTHSPDDPNFSNYYQLSFEITFGEGLPFEGLEVTGTLAKLTELADNIISKFDV